MVNTLNYKTSFYEGLKYTDVYITDTDPNSKYFSISGITDVFGGGKNSFLIAGTSLLKSNTKVKVEVLDKNEQVIYSEVVDYLENTIFRAISVYVYDFTTKGPATITVVGQLKDCPSSWDNKYNVKWIKNIVVDPLAKNTSPLRFYNTPLLSVSEKLRSYYEPTYASGSTQLTYSDGVVDCHKYSDKNYINSSLTIHSGSFNRYMVGGKLKIDDVIPYNDGSYILSSSSYDGTITNIINKNVAIITPAFTAKVINNNVNIPANFFSSSYTITYDNYIESFNKNNVYIKSFADISLKNISSFSGYISKLKVFKKSDYQLDYEYLGDFYLNNKEFMVDSEYNRVGYFDTASKWVDNWELSNLGFPVSTYVKGLIDSDYVLDSVRIESNPDAYYHTPIDIKYSNTGYRALNSYNYMFNLTNPITLSNGIYSLSGVLWDNSNLDDTYIDVYLSGSSTIDTSFGIYCGQLTYNKNQYSTFNLDIQLANSGSYYLYFGVHGKDFSFADISLKLNESITESPDISNFQIPIDVRRRNETLRFKVQFYDQTNNKSGVELETLPIVFVGGNTVVEGSDNLLSGSLHMGYKTGSGIELYGDAGAMVKSNGYVGFQSASNFGKSGFMMYSGSVLGGSGDDYNGVGLELHAGYGSGSLRFKANGSESFLEISGNLYAIDGYFSGIISASSGHIGGWVIGSHTLTGNNVVLDSSGSVYNISGAWSLDNNGSGHLANGGVNWDELGNVNTVGAFAVGNNKYIGNTFYAGNLRKNIWTRDSEDISTWDNSGSMSILKYAYESPDGNVNANWIINAKTSPTGSWVGVKFDSCSIHNDYVTYTFWHGGRYRGPLGGSPIIDVVLYDGVSETVVDSITHSGVGVDFYRKSYVHLFETSSHSGIYFRLQSSVVDPTIVSYIYIWGMQKEIGIHTTSSIYQKVDGYLTDSTSSFGMWASQGGIGGTTQHPNISFHEYGIKITGSYSHSMEDNAILIGNIYGEASNSIMISNNTEYNGIYGFDKDGTNLFTLNNLSTKTDPFSNSGGTYKISSFGFDKNKLYGYDSNNNFLFMVGSYLYSGSYMGVNASGSKYENTSSIFMGLFNNYIHYGSSEQYINSKYGIEIANSRGGSTGLYFETTEDDEDVGIGPRILKDSIYNHSVCTDYNTKNVIFNVISGDLSSFTTHDNTSDPLYGMMLVSGSMDYIDPYDVPVFSRYLFDNYNINSAMSDRVLFYCTDKGSRIGKFIFDDSGFYTQQKYGELSVAEFGVGSLDNAQYNNLFGNDKKSVHIGSLGDISYGIQVTNNSSSAFLISYENVKNELLFVVNKYSNNALDNNGIYIGSDIYGGNFGLWINNTSNDPIVGDRIFDICAPNMVIGDFTFKRTRTSSSLYYVDNGNDYRLYDIDNFVDIFNPHRIDRQTGYNLQYIRDINNNSANNYDVDSILQVKIVSGSKQFVAMNKSDLQSYLDITSMSQSISDLLLDYNQFKLEIL